MDKLEYDKRVLAIHKENQKAIQDVNRVIDNIYHTLNILMQRPHWQKLYKEQILGAFIDWWDRVIEDNKIFAKELEEVGLRAR